MVRAMRSWSGQIVDRRQAALRALSPLGRTMRRAWNSLRAVAAATATMRAALRRMQSRELVRALGSWVEARDARRRFMAAARRLRLLDRAKAWKQLSDMKESDGECLILLVPGDHPVIQYEDTLENRQVDLFDNMP